ncbi:MAG TPA: adenylate/guanylate cyclase domain-containing protein [Chthoniobacterales bacterium]|nr:adenylate/guanylate cyclase domain-containing protein [Chthoniobacterales bacterium]
MVNGACMAWLDAHDRQLPLVGRTCSLGRAKDNNVVFASEKVSRRHAVVHAQGAGEYWLADLGSSNGTHLNGRRLTQPVALQPGDTIQIGEQSFVFRIENEAQNGDEFPSTEAQMTVQDVSNLTCWFLILDIKNFVQLSCDLTTDGLARMVGAWLAECQRLIERHRGTISKFLGDGLLVYWDNRLSETAEIAGALGELRRMQDRRHPPFRGALHFGEAIFGSAAGMGELSVLGQDLNFVFRMERVAAEHDFACVVSEPASAQLAGFLAPPALGCFALKGFDGEFPMFGW